tara:strand:+ start:1624 stop:2796 length:1173 start_codon:yes stop_codon:yes gene_type:complete
MSLTREFLIHEVQPEVILDSYGEFNNVDMFLTFEGRKMLFNSVRILFDVEIEGLVGLDNTTTAKNLFYNHSAGGHAFVESIETQVRGSSVESLQEYARYVVMKTSSTKSSSDLCNGSSACEGKAPSNRLTNYLLRGYPSGYLSEGATGQGTVGTYPNSITTPLDVSFKPDICLNNSPNTSISYRKVGEQPVRLSIRLARNFSALYGADMGSAVSYKLTNLRVTFASVMDDGTDDPETLFRCKNNIKASFTGNFANIQAIVPAPANAVSISFQPQGNENQALLDNYQMYAPPDVRKVQFLFNDSTSQYISYVLENREEILDRAIESFSDTGGNEAQLYKLVGNNGYMLGLNFGEYVPFQNGQKFNLQLTSSIGTQAIPYIAYMYFHTLVVL